MWSEVQTFVYGARPPAASIWDAFIPTASEDAVDGLGDSTTQLVAALAQIMDYCWTASMADPQMIVQHGRQWQQVEPPGTMSGFRGYGNPVTITSTNMAIHPLDGQRREAARIMDDRRGDWYV